MQLTLMIVALVVLVTGAAGHGAMVSPAPRSSHNQTYDDRNKCGSTTPYSTTGMRKGEYCGIGCLGDACLYYQIGCFAGCPTCSLQGKDLYPTASDFAAANNCKPIEPTLGGGDAAHEYELRTMNIDGLSSMGDWTKPNPWRAPGTAGRGNPNFQPCGINSGSKVSFPDPTTTAQDVPKAGPGTLLPSLGSTSTWKGGSVVEASWALYANHGGGYSYRICKKGAKGEVPTEACFQQTPLDFADNMTEIRYIDGSRKPFTIPAVTTSVGTYPKGSMWRKNPVPMCNCDIGTGCGRKDAAVGPCHHAGKSEVASLGKQCVPDANCSRQVKTDTPGCKKCADSGDQMPAWSCAKGQCCPGYSEKEIAGGIYCYSSSPAPSPTPSDKYFSPYSKTHFHPGQTSTICPTGVQYETMWDDGMGAAGEQSGVFGTFMFEMVDKLKVPDNLAAGEYVLSWRWDCEETPQVWNSCADITVEASSQPQDYMV